MAEIGVDYFDPSIGGLTPVTPAKPLPVTNDTRDPLTGANYPGASATTEQLSGTVVPEVNPGLVNSAGTIDRLRTDGGGRLKTNDEDLLQKILREVRLTNQLLAMGLNIGEDIDNLRNEPSEDDLSGNTN